MTDPDIEPTGPEAMLAAELPQQEVRASEVGTSVYHECPPDPGATNMAARPEAIASLMAADELIAAGNGFNRFHRDRNRN